VRLRLLLHSDTECSTKFTAATPSREVYGIDDGDFLGLGLSSRKNLCIHPSVRHEKKGKAVDARCRDMTSSVAKARHEQDPGSVELCSFHEVRARP
jgi:DNA excision repair protein ERCC-2